MKLSNKLFFAACAVGLVALVGEKLAVRASFADRQKIEFKPGLEARDLKPLKVIVVESRLEPNAELNIDKGDRWAVAADHNFWDAATAEQRGDTLFIRQTADKHGKLDDPEERGVNNYAELTVLCPEAIAAVRSDISVFVKNMTLDSLSVEQMPNRFLPKYAQHRSYLHVKNCRLTGLALSTGANTEVEIDEKSPIGNLRLALRDSCSAKIDGPVAGRIQLDCSPRSRVSVSGENLSKIKN